MKFDGAIVSLKEIEVIDNAIEDICRELNQMEADMAMDDPNYQRFCEIRSKVVSMSHKWRKATTS